MRLIKRIQDFRKPKPHPVTGDMLNISERVSWSIMGIYRRWTFFFILQAVTIIWWTNPHLFPGGLAGWNYLWSDLSVVVEMMVGIAFFGQSIRDAKIIRQELGSISEEIALIREIHAVVMKTEGDDETV